MSARALNTVEEHVGEQGSSGISTGPARGPPPSRDGGGWHRTVGDVMTTSVAAVDRITSAKEIATLIAQHKVSAVPVLTMGRHVAGVVSETDLLRIEDQRERTPEPPAIGRSRAGGPAASRGASPRSS